MNVCECGNEGTKRKLAVPICRRLTFASSVRKVSECRCEFVCVFIVFW